MVLHTRCTNGLSWMACSSASLPLFMLFNSSSIWFNRDTFYLSEQASISESKVCFKWSAHLTEWRMKWKLITGCVNAEFGVPLQLFLDIPGEQQYREAVAPLSPFPPPKWSTVYCDDNNLVQAYGWLLRKQWCAIDIRTKAPSKHVA